MRIMNCCFSILRNRAARTVIIALVCFSALLLAGWAYSPESQPYTLQQRIAHHSYPKLFLQVQSYVADEEQLNEAAKWDLLVLDAELVVNGPEYLGSTGKIRQINPYAVIALYFSAADVIPGNTATVNAGFIAGLEDAWYMKDTFGGRCKLFELEKDFWTEMLNLTTEVKTFMPAYLKENILSTSLGDGIFYDNITETICWLNYRSPNPNGPLDIDNDGQADSDAKLDSRWVRGTKSLLTASRKVFPKGTIILGNGGWVFDDTFKKSLNGRMVENFVRGEELNLIGFGWHEVMRGHYLMDRVSVPPKLSMIMANGEEKNFKFMRFALASTLMFDGYFCYTNYGAYGSPWWYDEYAVDLTTGKANASASSKGYLGQPVSKAYDVDDQSVLLSARLVSDDPSSAEKTWRRDFKNGIVLVNPSSKKKKVNLGGKFRRIKGIFDRRFNNGRTVTSVVMDPRSGIVLLKK